jgi:parallel beta-helix repeat protein
MATPFRTESASARRRRLLAVVSLMGVLIWVPSALAVGDPPVNTERPAISGNARHGQTLTGTQGVWTGAQPMTFAYQWRRCDVNGNSCADIAGATSLTYGLGSADTGGRIHIRVTATNADGSTAQRSWNSAVVVSPPINAAVPSLSGIARVGETLSATSGTWVGTAPIAYAYQWRRCDVDGNNCASIGGTTGGAYVLVSADVGNRVQARVTATNAYGNEVKRTWNSAVVVSAAPPAPGVIDVKAGYGTSDSAVRAAITAAKAQGKALYFSAATYTYDSALVLDGLTAYGDGPGSVLSASNPASSALILRGAGPALRDLKVTSPNSVARSQAYIRANVQVDGASSFVVERLTIVEAEQNGIIVHHQANGGTIRNNTVSQTLADAIHITDASRDVVVTNNTVRNAGDDLIAVVSYLKDPAPCRNITIAGNDVSGQTNGRGISNVGGEFVTIQGNTISDTHGAGILVASDGDYGTYGPVGTQVLDNVVDTTDLGNIHHAGIQIFGQPGNLAQNTLVKGNVVRNTMYRGIYIGPDSKGTTVKDNTLQKIGKQGIYASGAVDLTVIGNTLTEIGTYGLYARSSVGGRLEFKSNTITWVNASDESSVDVIHVEPNTSLTSGEISGNKYKPHAGGFYDELVESRDPKVVVTGNLLI